MKSRIESLIKLSGIISIIIFFILFILKKPNNILNFWSLIIESVGYTVILILLYEKYLWRYNPFVKIPRLKKIYKGILKYNYNGIKGEKQIEIQIKQTYLSIDVTFISNEIRSRTITSQLINDNQEYILYYIYITTPSSEYSDKNPIQLGTCKLTIENSNQIYGTYWTSRKTTGDLYFEVDKN